MGIRKSLTFASGYTPYTCVSRRLHHWMQQYHFFRSDPIQKILSIGQFRSDPIPAHLTLNYGTASEHSDFDFMVLYNVFVLSWGLTIAQNSISTISDLDRSRRTDTRSTENDCIGADTDPEYRIDASLLKTSLYAEQLPCANCNQHKCCKSVPLSDLHNYFSELRAKTI